jgi:hypothetical protein
LEGLAFDVYLDAKASGKAGKHRDLRMAMDAAKALYHFREHIPAPYSKTWRDVARECPDYAILRDVVDADKHGELDDKTRAVWNTGQFQERMVITQYKDDQGEYTHIEKGVFLSLTDGSERDILGVLTNVINYWMSELPSLCGSRRLRPYDLPATVEPRPRAECNNGRLDFEMLKGLDLGITFQLKQYNPDTGRVEPVDLSGSEFEFTLRESPYQLTITLTHDATGHQIVRRVGLSDHEYEAVTSLRTSEHQNRYLMSLPAVKETYAEMAEEARRQGEGA